MAMLYDETLASQFSRLGVLNAMMVGLCRMYRKLCASDLFCGLKYASPSDCSLALFI